MKRKLLIALAMATLVLSGCGASSVDSTPDNVANADVGVADEENNEEETDVETEPEAEEPATEEADEGEESMLSEDTLDALDNLYSIQANYARGVAPLIEIPPMWPEQLYNDWDDIVAADVDNAPILLREYAVTDMVYFDYESDYSVVWDKQNDSVMVEATDVEERDEFMQKEHRDM